jgi:diacylglycerol kinase (ATP)
MLGHLGPHTLFESQSPGDATRLAQDAVAQGYTRVIAAGGDGTLNEVLNGLSNGFDHVQLGLIPLGTANDFARSAMISDDPQQAIELLQVGRSKRVDVVRMTTCTKPEPHYFINVSAGGFSTLVDQKLDDDTKSWWGPLGYALSAVKALPDLTVYNVTLSLDGEPPATVPVYNVVVANASHVGGHIPVAPKALLDDGRFDVVLFRAVALARLTTLVPKVMLGQHLDDEDVAYRQVSRMEISSNPAFELNADGEVVGPCPATFEVVPQAIEVIVGPEIKRA